MRRNPFIHQGLGRQTDYLQEACKLNRNSAPCPIDSPVSILTEFPRDLSVALVLLVTASFQVQMPRAGKLSSWAPLSSSATPSDSDPTTDKLKTSPRPTRTFNLLDDELSASKSGYRRISYGRSDFYKRYSEHWERNYDCASSWEEEAAESALCYTEDETEDEDEDEDEDENCDLLGKKREMASWSGQPDIKGRTEWIRMMLLCAVHFGITFTWGVEMTYCTPYLLNLGLTKSQTSLVWIAGPLSGLITQPIVGALADSTRSRWGRRRPYIAVGSIIVAGGLITLGWTKELVSLIMPTETEFAKLFIIFLAVLALYVTDFAINAGTKLLVPSHLFLH